MYFSSCPPELFVNGNTPARSWLITGSPGDVEMMRFTFPKDHSATTWPLDAPCLSLSQFFKELCFEKALSLSSEDSLLQRLALFSFIFTCVCTPNFLNQVSCVYDHTTLNTPELIKQVS